jgi:hypothetical protein
VEAARADYVWPSSKGRLVRAPGRRGMPAGSCDGARKGGEDHRFGGNGDVKQNCEGWGNYICVSPPIEGM